MTLSAIFPTLTTPLRYPSQDLPYSSLSGFGASSRGPVVKLGALSPEARGRANATIDRLSTLSLALERDLHRLVNRGEEVSGVLAADITSAAGEVEELAANLDTIDSDTALTQTWSEWARGLEGILSSLRQQLNAFEGATTTTRARYVALGVASAAVLGGLGAYYVFRKGKRK